VSGLDPDRGEIARFVEATFLSAVEGTVVLLRAFCGDRPWRTDLWRAVRLGADRRPLIDAAAGLAGQCANAEIPVVF
jgi:hypothetical protein